MKLIPTAADHKPPEIWEFERISDERARGLAMKVLFSGLREEDEDLADALVKLIAGISAYHECACNEASCIGSVTWAVIKEAYTHTDSFNKAFFNYVVNEIQIAHDFRRHVKTEVRDE